MDIYDDVKKVLLDKLNISEALIKPESNLINDLGVSSLDRVDIEMELEEKFNIELSDLEAQTIVNPHDIAMIIERKLKLNNKDT